MLRSALKMPRNVMKGFRGDDRHKKYLYMKGIPKVGH